ncbi:MAG: DNA polymerase, partial [Patescibacteria group bacterium]
MSCILCPLHKTAKSICIPGRGSESPKFLFVGQAPGQDEDQQNKVFVGPAGQFLLDAIKEYDLLPARLTNTVRCFPPQDREPRVEEVEKCRLYLMQEIEEVKPNIIVALGNIALKALTGKTGITTYSGRVVGKIGESKVFALYHPSYILREPQNVYWFELHLKELQKLGGGIKKVPVPQVQHLTPNQALSVLTLYDKPPFVTFDYETTCLNPFEKDAMIRCCGFHIEDRTLVVENNGEDFTKLMEWFIQSDFKKCAHNMIFESIWSLVKFGAIPRNLVFDTMLLHYLMDENKPHDLEYVAGSMIGVSPWDLAATMKENNWDNQNVPFGVLAEYCGKDVCYTHRVMELLKYQIKEKTFSPVNQDKLTEFYQKILLPLARLCVQYQYRGMKIDLDWCKKQGLKYDLACKQLYLQMRMIKELEKVGEFNPASSDQVREILTKRLKIKLKKETKKGKLSTGKDVLEDIKSDHPFIGLLLDWREKNTRRNNYFNKLPKLTDGNGFVHPSCNPAFQVTSRVSISDPPMGNTAKDARGVVISRFGGKDGGILSLDYKQLEMRLIASESEDERMLSVFQAGRDIHDDAALEIFGKGYTDEERKKAKSVNFLTVYGGGAGTLSFKFKVKYEEAQDWLYKHRRTYKKLYQWTAKQHLQAKHHGWVESRFGTLRRFPEIVNADEEQTARILRQAGNFP